MSKTPPHTLSRRERQIMDIVARVATGGEQFITPARIDIVRNAWGLAARTGATRRPPCCARGPNNFKSCSPSPISSQAWCWATGVHCTGCCSGARHGPYNDRSATSAGCKRRRAWCCTLGTSDWGTIRTCMRSFPAAAHRWMGRDGCPVGIPPPHGRNRRNLF